MLPIDAHVFRGIKRMMPIDAALFEAHNRQRDLDALKWTLPPTNASINTLTVHEHSDAEIWCDIDGCDYAFRTLAAHASHYQMTHMNVCSVCQLVFQSQRYLEIHLSERHDPLHGMMHKEDAFTCLVDGCKKRFRTRGGRKQHLVDAHAFPSTFIFDETTTRRTQKKRHTPGVKTTVDAKRQLRNKRRNAKRKEKRQQERAAKQPTMMDVDTMNSTTVHGETAVDSDGDQQMNDIIDTISRVKISVPKEICFGRGRGRGRRR